MRRATELAGGGHQHVVAQPAVVQVGQEGHDGLVQLGQQPGVAARVIVVGVEVGAHGDVHDAHQRVLGEQPGREPQGLAQCRARVVGRVLLVLQPGQHAGHVDGVPGAPPGLAQRVGPGHGGHLAERVLEGPPGLVALVGPGQVAGAVGARDGERRRLGRLHRRVVAGAERQAHDAGRRVGQLVAQAAQEPGGQAGGALHVAAPPPVHHGEVRAVGRRGAQALHHGQALVLQALQVLVEGQVVGHLEELVVGHAGALAQVAVAGQAVGHQRRHAVVAAVELDHHQPPGGLARRRPDPGGRRRGGAGARRRGGPGAGGRGAGGRRTGLGVGAGGEPEAGRGPGAQGEEAAAVEGGHGRSPGEGVDGGMRVASGQATQNSGQVTTRACRTLARSRRPSTAPTAVRSAATVSSLGS